MRVLEEDPPPGATSTGSQAQNRMDMNMYNHFFIQFYLVGKKMLFLLRESVGINVESEYVVILDILYVNRHENSH